ncbi:MAG TPA: TonB family protein [Acidobacteria bacterium]|nr:TonB family protein [Acidobacteriota bacterium]
MYFDLEERFFDTPTVESAMSWRERGLLSLFVHVAIVLLYLFGPLLPFVRDAAERRAERLAAMTPAEQVVRREPVDEPQFIFVAPFVDTPAAEPPPQASLSDLDRAAQSPTQAEAPLNNLPNADGNTFEFVQAEERSDGLDPETSDGTDPDATEGDTVEPVEGVEDGAVDPPDEETLETSPGDGGAVANPLLADAGDALSPPKPTPTPGALLRQAERRLDSVSRGQSFQNLAGRTDQYGPDIQFDSKGVDFGSWIRRFRAQIYRNWTLPYAAMSMHGHVVLTFTINREGRLSDLTVRRPSAVDAFTNSAFNAMSVSNPTHPLPPEYPEESVVFTVTFYFNEIPPNRLPNSR